MRIEGIKESKHEADELRRTGDISMASVVEWAIYKAILIEIAYGDFGEASHWATLAIDRERTQ